MFDYGIPSTLHIACDISGVYYTFIEWVAESLAVVVPQGFTS